MSIQPNSEQNKEFSGQEMPAWAAALLANMKRRKASAVRVVLSPGLRAAAARQQARQQTKGYGYAFGARKFTGAW
jgi:hypothetical protein